jgi:hypothetical protein
MKRGVARDVRSATEGELKHAALAGRMGSCSRLAIYQESQRRMLGSVTDEGGQ